MDPYIGVDDVPVTVFVHLMMENDVRVGTLRMLILDAYVLRERRVATPEHQYPGGLFWDELSNDVCDILVRFEPVERRLFRLPFQRY